MSSACLFLLKVFFFQTRLILQETQQAIEKVREAFNLVPVPKKSDSDQTQQQGSSAQQTESGNGNKKRGRPAKSDTDAEPPLKKHQPGPAITQSTQIKKAESKKVIFLDSEDESSITNELPQKQESPTKKQQSPKKQQSLDVFGFSSNPSPPKIVKRVAPTLVSPTTTITTTTTTVPTSGTTTTPVKRIAPTLVSSPQPKK